MPDAPGVSLVCACRETHIPPWLPNLPPAVSWKTSQALDLTSNVAKNTGKQRHEAERSLVKLRDKVPQAFGSIEVRQGQEVSGESSENPFLQPPEVVASE